MLGKLCTTFLFRKGWFSGMLAGRILYAPYSKTITKCCLYKRIYFITPNHFFDHLIINDHKLTPIQHRNVWDEQDCVFHFIFCLVIKLIWPKKKFFDTIQHCYLTLYQSLNHKREQIVQNKKKFPFGVVLRYIFIIIYSSPPSPLYQCWITCVWFDFNFEHWWWGKGGCHLCYNYRFSIKITGNKHIFSLRC